MTDHAEVRELFTSAWAHQRDGQTAKAERLFSGALASLQALEDERAELMRALAAAQEAIRKLPVITDEMEAERDRYREALPPADKLEAVAAWLDVTDHITREGLAKGWFDGDADLLTRLRELVAGPANTRMQTDLRAWAVAARAALTEEPSDDGR